MNLFNFLSSSAILTVIDEGGLTNIELSGIDGLVKIIIEFLSFGGLIGVGILLFSLILKILPLQMIKIEEEAVIDLEKNERARRLADSLIYMAKQLKVKIIFSGVSSKKQWNILKNLGADFLMGPINGTKVYLQESDGLLEEPKL